MVPVFHQAGQPIALCSAGYPPIRASSPRWLVCGVSGAPPTGRAQLPTPPPRTAAAHLDSHTKILYDRRGGGVSHHEATSPAVCQRQLAVRRHRTTLAPTTPSLNLVVWSQPLRRVLGRQGGRYYLAAADPVSGPPRTFCGLDRLVPSALFRRHTPSASFPRLSHRVARGSPHRLFPVTSHSPPALFSQICTDAPILPRQPKAPSSRLRTSSWGPARVPESIQGASRLVEPGFLSERAPALSTSPSPARSLAEGRCVSFAGACATFVPPPSREPLSRRPPPLVPPTTGELPPSGLSAAG